MTRVARISSRRNPRFKLWKRMLERPEKQDPWLAVEGAKAVRELARRRPIALLLVNETDADGDAPPPAAEVVALPFSLFRTLSRVESPQAFIAFFEKPKFEWHDLPPWLLFLDRLQDPGNLGTLVRTAAAAGDFGITAGPGTVSRFNPKAVRAAAGLLYITPFLGDVEPPEVQQHGYQLYASTPQAGTSLFELPFAAPCCFAVGNEGGGLDMKILETADELFHIPMQPGAESLNAAVAGSLMIYEVVRRRS